MDMTSIEILLSIFVFVLACCVARLYDRIGELEDHQS